MSGILLNAYLPSTAPKMMDQLGLDASALDLSKTVYGAQETYTVHKGDALFPRIDVAKEIAHLKEEDEKRKAAAEAANKAKAEAEKKAAAPAEENGVDFTHEEEIDFDTFCKVELRVAEVRACENLKESKKLLHLTVFDGERERCILSGIAKWFKPEDLIGKKIGIVCNLAPRPMMKGKYVSEGMILLPTPPTAAAPSLSTVTTCLWAAASTKPWRKRRFPVQKSWTGSSARRYMPCCWPFSAMYCGVRRSRSSRWATACFPLIPATPPPSSALQEYGSCWAAFWCCWAVSLLQNRVPKLPRGKVAAECCALGLWQTTTQYAFYYIAVAMLTGAFGGILNSTQSFLGVIFAHFLYGKNDRMTPRQAAGLCAGFCRSAHRHPGQPRRRQQLGHLLHAAGHGHLYPVRPVEQGRDQKGRQLCGLLYQPVCGRRSPCLCWALRWADIWAV